jgi:hypothetical protein
MRDYRRKVFGHFEEPAYLIKQFRGSRGDYLSDVDVQWLWVENKTDVGVQAFNHDSLRFRGVIRCGAR